MIDSISLTNGIGYCPCCAEQNKAFRLTPHLLASTRGTNIPMFCRYCKREFVVDIDTPNIAVVRSITMLPQRGNRV